MIKKDDIVTRAGTDRHRVIYANDPGDLLTLRCIDTGHANIWEMGEIETNLTRRYDLVYPAEQINWARSGDLHTVHLHQPVSIVTLTELDLCTRSEFHKSIEDLKQALNATFVPQFKKTLKTLQSYLKKFTKLFKFN